MTYDFSERLDLLGTRMKDLHAESLLYSRDDREVNIYPFTPEKCDTEQLQAMGIAILNEKWQDFIFDASLLSPYSPAEPEAGDKIFWGQRGFQVAPIGDELYKFTTSTRKRIRVHAKQISSNDLN